MVIGAGKITLRLSDCHSLKGKRKVIKAIMKRIRNNFDVSIAEVGANDIHQRSQIGFVIVGNSKKIINSRMDNILNFTEDIGMSEIIDSEMEIIIL